MSLLVALCSLALAAPPSSTLTGPDGTLAWVVRPDVSGVRIEGSSPQWTVTHTARADLTPLRTERTASDGTRVTIEYGAVETVVRLPDRVVRHGNGDLWDADTLDVRLGDRVAAGWTDASFAAIDPESGKVYRFDAAEVARTTCEGVPCAQVDLTLAGVLRLFGPTWRYWYASDGRLLRFEGPMGTFAADGGAR